MEESESTPSPDLPAHERLEILQRKSPSAAVVHEAIRLEGEEVLSRPNSSVWWSSLAAGLTIGFSLIAEGILRAKLPEAPWRDLVTSFGYSAGFLFVTLGRQQLFTETTLTASMPALHNPARILDLGRFWALVFIANIVGSILFALGASTPTLFTEDVHSAFVAIGTEAAEPAFGTMFVRAVVAGWLIALMVWLLPFSGSARVLVIVGVTYLIGVGQLVHVIAGSVEVAYAAAVGAVTWETYIFRFLLPAFLGNTVGGVVFVALLNYAQVRKEV